MIRSYSTTSYSQQEYHLVLSSFQRVISFQHSSQYSVSREGKFVAPKWDNLAFHSRTILCSTVEQFRVLHGSNSVSHS